jgi:hypothetical protein
MTADDWKPIDSDTNPPPFGVKFRGWTVGDYEVHVERFKDGDGQPLFLDADGCQYTLTHWQPIVPPKQEPNQ